MSCKNTRQIKFIESFWKTLNYGGYVDPKSAECPTIGIVKDENGRDAIQIRTVESKGVEKVRTFKRYLYEDSTPTPYVSIFNKLASSKNPITYYTLRTPYALSDEKFQQALKAIRSHKHLPHIDSPSYSNSDETPLKPKEKEQ